MKKKYFLFCSCGEKMRTKTPWLAVWFKAIHLDKGHDITFYVVRRCYNVESFNDGV